MKLDLRFFASLREALGTGQETIDLPEEIQTIAQLRKYLCARQGVWSTVLAEGKVLRCALNHEMVDGGTILQEGAEIAFFPPVTGG